jgi:neutral ceramidase
LICPEGCTILKEETSVLRAGVARSPITPPIGATLVGYPTPERCAEQVRDPLYATALVLDDGQKRVALLSCDLMAIHPDVVEEVRARSRQRSGIAPDSLMICSSHTHSGPPSHALPASREVDHAYVAQLPEVLVRTIASAASGLLPVRMRYGSAHAGIGINRREVRPDGRVVLGHNPGGPVDHEVRVVTLEGPEGQAVAVLVNYACHPVVLGPPSAAISADFVGRMRAQVEDTTGSTVLFLQGACADINPRLGPASDEGQADLLGAEVADAVLRACNTSAPVAIAPLSCATAQLNLPLLGDTTGIPHFPSDQELKALQEGIDRWDPWSAEVVTGPEGRLEVPLALQAMRLGGFTILGIPVEPFVEIGLALKAAYANTPTLIAGYSNGCAGYIPMPEAYALGGYEVSSSFISPRLPGPFAPECADSIIAAGRELLDLVRST